MVCKIKISKGATTQSFGALCKYALGPGKEAEVLDCNGVRDTTAGDMTEDFEYQRRLNPRLGRAPMHAILAFAEKDMTNEQMVAATRGWMKKMDIDPETTQWAFVRHRDTDNDHGHLLINRGNEDGSTISDQHNYRRGAAACRAMEREHGLISAVDVSQDNRRAKREQLPTNDVSKLYMQDSMSRHRPQVTSPAELLAAMKADGINSVAKFGDKGKLTMVTFEYNGYHMKGSQLGRDCSGPALTKSIEAQAERVQQERGGMLAFIAGYGAAAQQAEAADKREVEAKQARERQAQQARERQAQQDRERQAQQVAEAARQAQQVAEAARQAQQVAEAARQAQQDRERQAQQVAEAARQAQIEAAAQQAAEGARVRAAEQVKIEQISRSILGTNPNIFDGKDLTTALAKAGVDASGEDGNRRLRLRGSDNEFSTTELRGKDESSTLRELVGEKMKNNINRREAAREAAAPAKSNDIERDDD